MNCCSQTSLKEEISSDSFPSFLPNLRQASAEEKNLVNFHQRYTTRSKTVASRQISVSFCAHTELTPKCSPQCAASVKRTEGLEKPVKRPVTGFQIKLCGENPPIDRSRRAWSRET
ncbi:hypothetical protein RRG08_012993 [Elysia crispata]|uniref:Uncharacterized protein n=1 Tax=Elysia crispata TaxID=231223 RepID=A0AAE1A1V3_9GAST|nr:hypothetical protein RRG08_012993 [Elysia crispata]